MFGGNSSNLTLNTLAAPSPPSTFTARHSVQLTDDGPVSAQPQSKPSVAKTKRSSATIASQISTATSGSYDDMPSPVFTTAFGDLRPNRDSMISLAEAEHGWSSHPSGLKAKERSERPRFAHTASVDSVHAPKPVKAPYRPPFAPSAALSDNDESTDDVQVLPTLASLSPKKDPALSRGRSLREKIEGVMRGGRSKSIDRTNQPQLSSSVPTTSFMRPPHNKHESTGSLDSSKDVVILSRSGRGPAEDSSGNESSTKEGLVSGIARHLSRKTIRRPRRNSADDLARAGITLPTQTELDNIPLYAAPPEAGIKNAPMLSSYPPRAPLRPRSLTDAGPTVQRSITVKEARLAYAKSLSRPAGTGGRHRAARQQQQQEGEAIPSSAPPASRDLPAVPGSGPTSPTSTISDRKRLSNRPSRASLTESLNPSMLSTGEDALHMRSKPRRSRVVPEGWTTFQNGEIPAVAPRDSSNPQKENTNGGVAI